MELDIFKVLMELANDSVMAFFALMDGFDYAQTHGHDMLAVAKVVLFLGVFLVSNVLLKNAWKERRKWKEENSNYQAKRKPPAGKYIYANNAPKVYIVELRKRQ